jgi:hypothetical protein
MTEAMKQGKAALKALLARKVSYCRVTPMTGPSTEIDSDDLDEMYDFLQSAEVVEGPPGLGAMAGAPSQGEASDIGDALMARAKASLPATTTVW